MSHEGLVVVEVSMRMRLLAVAMAIVLGFGGVGLAQAPKADQKKVKDWANGQQVEVKWGGQYRKASIINRRGEWYLVNYQPGPFREWVEHWRIRKVGDNQDPIGYAKPNKAWKAGDNPPQESAGEPPE